MSDREAMEVELSELRAANEKATSWGAAVAARSERIKEIESTLRRMDSSTGAPAALEHSAALVQEAISDLLLDRAFDITSPMFKRNRQNAADACAAEILKITSAAPTVRSAAMTKPAPAPRSSLPSGESDPAVTLDQAGAGTTSPEPDAVTDAMVEAAVAEFRFAYHEHADTPTGHRNMMRRALTAALARKQCAPPQPNTDGGKS